MISYESSLTGEMVTIQNSLHHLISHYELPYLLEFLLESQDTHFRIVWDIDQFSAPILSLMTHEQKSTLWNENKVRIEPYEIIYNPRKSLTIRKYRFTATYYHISQYWPDEGPQDLLQCVRKGIELLEALKSINVEPKRLSSPIALIDEVFERFPLPTWQSLPDEVGQLSWEHSGLRWTEAHQLGHFEETWDYDLNSSFPWAATQLLNTDYGIWKESTSIPEDAIYGWAYCTITINSSISPIMYKDSKGELYNPRGTWPGILTLHEMRMIDQRETDSYKIKSGWFWIPRQLVRPLYYVIHGLYKQRSASPLLKRILKGAMVGIYGKFLQQYSDGSFAPSFFPPWGSMIEVMIRLKDAELIYSNRIEDHVLHVSTDGVLTNVCLPINDAYGKMGDWRLDYEGPALIVSSGAIWYGNKRPNSLSYDEAIAMIREHPKRREWSKDNTRIWTLGDIVTGNSDNMGTPGQVVSGFAIALEHDREFTPHPIYGHNLLHDKYKSQPLEPRWRGE